MNPHTPHNGTMNPKQFWSWVTTLILNMMNLNVIFCYVFYLFIKYIIIQKCLPNYITNWNIENLHRKVVPCNCFRLIVNTPTVCIFKFESVDSSTNNQFHQPRFLNYRSDIELMLIIHIICLLNCFLYFIFNSFPSIWVIV